MTREESRVQTRIKIRNSKSGGDIAKAIKEHFRTYKDKTPEVEVLAELNSPLFGL